MLNICLPFDYFAHFLHSQKVHLYPVWCLHSHWFLFDSQFSDGVLAQPKMKDDCCCCTYSKHRQQLFLCFCFWQIRNWRLLAIQPRFKRQRLRYALKFGQNVWKASHIVARKSRNQWGGRTGHRHRHPPAVSSRTRNLWLEDQEWRGAFLLI